jgi:hypothetical protein
MLSPYLPNTFTLKGSHRSEPSPTRRAWNNFRLRSTPGGGARPTGDESLNPRFAIAERPIRAVNEHRVDHDVIRSDG